MSKIIEKNRLKNRRKRKLIDNFYIGATFFSSIIGAITLLAILVYVFSKGSGLISWKLITGDYFASEYHVAVEPTTYCNCIEPTDLPDEAVYSSKWGVGFIVVKDSSGLDQIVFTNMSSESPLHEAYDLYDNENQVYLKDNLKINRITFSDNTFVISKMGIDKIVTELENHDSITELYVSGDGGGIRGSLISTLYMIFFTLLFALPIGIFTAIYLNEYAKKGWVTNQLRRFIEMLTGVPSIIFGMVGLVVFIPMTSIFGFSGRNIIAASLTLTVIILPTIIRATEESLKVIPKELRQASLALGANSTQTTFRVVLPNAIPGILTATLLGIGRVIGESAALIFVMGTTINDHIALDGGSTSLAVQIWSVMSGESPNFELASAISIIILIMVLVLNLLIKYISSRLTKAWQ